MKRAINHLLALAPALLLMASCETETDRVGGGRQERVLLVSSENVDTRTTIDYELSDYSHLVWNAGDQVAYVTDVASVAEVKEGSFEAKVPAEYGERNKLFILYPSDGLEGLNVDKMKMELPAEQHQDTLGSTRGVVVPMYAVADIPGEGVNTMKVRYEFPAATLRFRIESQEHKLEKVLSVTMTAQDPIGGSMIFSRPSNVIKLIKPVNEVKVVVDKPATIEKGGYLYMKVMRGTYSNVTVAVTTDQNTYLFENGTFDLTDPDASLFKVNLSLDAGKVEPKTLYYKEISEGEVFTADAKYLIAHKNSDTEYHVAASFSTYYLSRKTFEADENGIEATSDVSQYAFTIAPVEGTEYVTLYSEAVSNSAPSAMHGKGYVGSPASSYIDPGHFVRGSEEDFDNPAALLLEDHLRGRPSRYRQRAGRRLSNRLRVVGHAVCTLQEQQYRYGTDRDPETRGVTYLSESFGGGRHPVCGWRLPPFCPSGCSLPAGSSLPVLPFRSRPSPPCDAVGSSISALRSVPVRLHPAMRSVPAVAFPRRAPSVPMPRCASGRLPFLVSSCGVFPAGGPKTALFICRAARLSLSLPCERSVETYGAGLHRLAPRGRIHRRLPRCAALRRLLPRLPQLRPQLGLPALRFRYG